MAIGRGRRITTTYNSTKKTHIDTLTLTSHQPHIVIYAYPPTWYPKHEIKTKRKDTVEETKSRSCQPYLKTNGSYGLVFFSPNVKGPLPGCGDPAPNTKPVLAVFWPFWAGKSCVEQNGLILIRLKWDRNSEARPGSFRAPALPDLCLGSRLMCFGSSKEHRRFSA